MKNNIKTASVLFAICAVSAVLLSAVNSLTSPIIMRNEKKAALEALERVSSSMVIGEEVSVEGDDIVKSYYPLYEGNQLGGYILNMESKGYGGEFTVIAGYDSDGKILSAEMGTNSETPGVGKKAEKPGYMDIFKGFKGSSIPVSKSMLSEKDSSLVSGATLTFNGISKALSYGSSFVLTLGGTL